MIITKDGNKVTIEFDTDAEKGTADWLWEQYQEHFLKGILVDILSDQQRARIAARIRKEIEDEIGTQY